MISLRRKIFNLFLIIIMVSLVSFFGYPFTLNQASADCSDVDFSEVQTRYDKDSSFFNNNTWLSNIRNHTNIMIYGGGLTAENDKPLQLNPIIVRLSGHGCDFEGVRIILTDNNNTTLDKVIINRAGQAVLNIPKSEERYPLVISVPLLRKERSMEHYSRKIYTDVQLISYLCHSNITMYNKDLYKHLLLLWMDNPLHNNQNIFNKIADLLKFVNNDDAKLAVMCNNKQAVKKYINGIDEVEGNNNNVAIFKDELNCLFE